MDLYALKDVIREQWAQSLPFVAGVVFLVWISALWVAKRLIVRHLEGWASKTSADWDDVVVRSASFPLNFLIFASGIYLVTKILPLSSQVDQTMTVVMQASFIFAAVFFLDRLISGVLSLKMGRAYFGVISQGATKGLIRAFVIGIGILIFLDLIGISITPILASLGIGSVAVALALQDTLSNLFAGIYVSIDKPVRVGDFVKLESGEEGYVTDVGWRSTRVQMLANNTVVVPNSKIVTSVITNYYLPEKELAVLVQVGVHYDSDLEHVERVTCEVAREVLKRVPGAVTGFEPFIRFHTFSDSSVNFSVILRGKEFVDNYLIKHEFIKALHKRYAQEGIVIPFPMRTLTMDKGTIEGLSGAFAGKGAKQ